MDMAIILVSKKPFNPFFGVTVFRSRFFTLKPQLLMIRMPSQLSSIQFKTGPYKIVDISIPPTPIVICCGVNLDPDTY